MILTNCNLILREDYEESFKKGMQWKYVKSFLKSEGIGEVYPSYSNSKKDRHVGAVEWCSRWF